MKSSPQKLSFVIPCLLLGIVYIADSFREPLITTPVFLGLTILGMWFVWTSSLKSSNDSFFNNKVASFWSTKDFWSTGEVKWWIRVFAFLSIGLLWLLLSEQLYQNMKIYAFDGTMIYVAGIISVLILIGLIIKPPKPLYALLAFVISGLIIRAVGLWQWDINPAKRDMLALMISAIDAFMSGDNPYGLHQMQVGSQVPLTYPPGLWLLYMPAQWLKIDIRWMSWIADAVVVMSLCFFIIKKYAQKAGPFLAFAAIYLFLPDVHWNGIYAEPNVDWAILACLAACIAWNKPLISSVIMGVAFSTRPFNIILFPFFAIWIWREFGLRSVFRTTIISGLIAAAIYLPFVLRNPDDFYLGTVRWLVNYGEAHNRWFWGMMGFSGVLYKNDLAHLMLPIQLGIIVVLTGFAVWKLKNNRHLLVFLTLAYGLFVAFNSIIWMSFWIGVCILAAFAMLSTFCINEKIDKYKSILFKKSRLLTSFEVAGFAVVIFSSGILLFLLLSHFGHNGEIEARQYLKQNMQTTDLLLDQSGYRIAFLKAPSFIDEPQCFVAHNPFVSTLPKKRKIDIMKVKTVWVVSRFGLFDSNMAKIYLGEDNKDGPFKIVEDKTFKKYQIYKMERQALGKTIMHLTNAQLANGLNKIEITDIKNSQKTYLFLQGRINKRAAKWKRSDINVEVFANNNSIGMLIVKNTYQKTAATFVLPTKTSTIEMKIKTDPKRRRQLKLDGIIFK